MNLSLINEMIEAGYIQVKKHSDADLFIYNYSPKAQYDRIWNEATLACRGLILDGDGNIIARPFQKFFNLGEFEGQYLPASVFEVYDKLDGSLGITYQLNGKWQIATRGSFFQIKQLKRRKCCINIITQRYTNWRLEKPIYLKLFIRKIELS